MIRNLVYTAVALMVVTPTASLGADNVRGWIDVEHGGALTSFTGFVESTSDANLRYTLTAEKQGRSGHTQSSQGGRVHLVANMPSRLSRTQVSIGEGDVYCVELTVYDGDTVVARDVAKAPSQTDAPTTCE